MILRIPPQGNRDALVASVSVDDERVVSADSGLEFMIGWSSETLRKYCKAVGWAASVAREN